MNNFNSDLIQFSSPGYASVHALKSQTAEKLKIIKADEDSHIDDSLKKIAKQIQQECKKICLDKSRYVLNIDVEVINDCISETLQKLLSFLSSKLDPTLPAALIGNIITGTLKHHSTSLQISLGVLFRESKKILGYTHNFGIPVLKMKFHILRSQQQ